MHGIYLTAILTTGIAAAIFVRLIHKLKMPAKEGLVWLAAIVALPLQPLAFYLVRHSARPLGCRSTWVHLPDLSVCDLGIRRSDDAALAW
jgi:hypothetical protein